MEYKPAMAKPTPPAAALHDLLAANGADKAALRQAVSQWLGVERGLLKKAYLESGGAYAFLANHTRMIDRLLGALYALFARPGASGVALMAVGGYGREELYPFSDIDLQFLYSEGEKKEAARVAEAILYVLWDLGFKVGQAHRTLKQTLDDARADHVVCTNLLDARLVAGDDALFAQWQQRMEAEVLNDSALAFVEAKLAERDSRHARFGDSRYRLEPNVKEGKGGLRDLHTIWWLARYCYRVQALRDFVARGMLTQEEFDAFDEARQFLSRVRIYLHYAANRAEERLTFDRQHELAVMMGYPHPSANRAIERFMRRYFVAVRTVGNTTRIFCAMLEEEKLRKPRKPIAWLWHTPWALGPFKLEGERLMVRQEEALADDPALMLDIFRLAQEHDLDIHPRAWQFIGRNVKRINDEVQDDARANDIFLKILLSDQPIEPALRRLSESGVLGRFIPDFGRVVGQTQFNMYHVYTVDEHTLVALGILQAIEKGRLKNELPLASDVVHRVKSRRVLYLALFCHDIAKGRGGDHSELGERIVIKLARRMGFSADEVETVAWLVRYHLLFSNTAFKRDINDPKTVADFVAEVKTPERLKLLLVLTVADMRAVSPIVWNAWKGSLMRDLYTRAQQAMGALHAEPHDRQIDVFRAALARQLKDWPQPMVEAYMEQGNAGFWASAPAAHHATIARMHEQAKIMPQPLLVHTDHDYERSYTEITVCALDQHGLFSKLAGAIALAGANIVTAKIFTLKDGMAVDIFQVQDATGGVFDQPDQLARMSVFIEQALTGELDLPRAFAKRKGSRRKTALSIAGQVFIENDASNIHTVIEVSGQDRSGFLYDVTRAIAELGLSIATAHISTYGQQAADVFYVKDFFGMKITHDAKIRQVREKLLQVVSSPAPGAPKAP